MPALIGPGNALAPVPGVAVGGGEQGEDPSVEAVPDDHSVAPGGIVHIVPGP